MAGEPGGAAPQRLHQNLAWLGHHLPRFTPDPGQEERSRFKPLTELAVIHASLTAWGAAAGDDTVGAALDRWRELLTEACTDGVVPRAARDRPADGLYVMQPYLWLRSTGYRSDACEDVLRFLQRDGHRPQSAGVLYSLRKAGYIRREIDWARLCREVLGRSYTPAALDHDAYRITHAVFYATDMGGARPALGDEETHRLAALLRRVAERADTGGRWDLLTEALVALSFLGAAPTTGDESALQRLAAAHRPDGAVPLDARAARELPTEPDEDSRRAVFGRCYHSTLVHVLLGAHRASSLPEGKVMPSVR
ncbi:DUF6895 family protein [Streptomyces shaanxiensis]|uniref:DUF6895 domain-containing protein n=1 Tax=Streptomyces shaanxiensis TaxID=653357 RepID=A0ABP7UKB1_9ACTN